MTPSDPDAAVEGLRRFLKRHATCGGTALDTPELPGGLGYRAVVACRCGDTAEYWLKDALLARDHLVAIVTTRQVA